MVLSSNWSTNIGDFGKFMSIILGLYVGKHHMLYHHAHRQAYGGEVKDCEGQLDINNADIIDVNLR